MDLQKIWDELYQAHRLAFVTGLSHDVLERWIDLEVGDIRVTDGFIPTLVFSLTNKKGRYEITYSAHDRLFFIELKDLTSNENVLRYDYAGIRYLPVDWDSQITIWKEFFEDLRRHCSTYLREKEKMK